jgi:hypothetical protein
MQDDVMVPKEELLSSIVNTEVVNKTHTRVKYWKRKAKRKAGKVKPIGYLDDVVSK